MSMIKMWLTILLALPAPVLLAALIIVLFYQASHFSEDLQRTRKRTSALEKFMEGAAKAINKSHEHDTTIDSLAEKVRDLERAGRTNSDASRLNDRNIRSLQAQIDDVNGEFKTLRKRPMNQSNAVSPPVTLLRVHSVAEEKAKECMQGLQVSMRNEIAAMQKLFDDKYGKLEEASRGMKAKIDGYESLTVNLQDSNTKLDEAAHWLNSKVDSHESLIANLQASNAELEAKLKTCESAIADRHTKDTKADNGLPEMASPVVGMPSNLPAQITKRRSNAVNRRFVESIFARVVKKWNRQHGTQRGKHVQDAIAHRRKSTSGQAEKMDIVTEDETTNFSEQQRAQTVLQAPISQSVGNMDVDSEAAMTKVSKQQPVQTIPQAPVGQSVEKMDSKAGTARVFQQQPTQTIPQAPVGQSSINSAGDLRGPSNGEGPGNSHAQSHNDKTKTSATVASTFQPDEYIPMVPLKSSAYVVSDKKRTRAAITIYTTLSNIWAEGASNNGNWADDGKARRIALVAERTAQLRAFVDKIEYKQSIKMVTDMLTTGLKSGSAEKKAEFHEKRLSALQNNWPKYEEEVKLNKDDAKGGSLVPLALVPQIDSVSTIDLKVRFQCVMAFYHHIYTAAEKCGAGPTRDSCIEFAQEVESHIYNINPTSEDYHNAIVVYESNLKEYQNAGWDGVDFKALYDSKMAEQAPKNS